MSDVSATITVDVQRWPCQQPPVRVYERGYGFRFTYCDQPMHYLISWTENDRYRSRRQLHVCAQHGAEFAERHRLDTNESAAPVHPAAAKAPSSDGGPNRAEIPSAAHALARGTDTAAVTSQDRASSPDDDPFGDADQPYARVRGAS